MASARSEMLKALAVGDYRRLVDVWREVMPNMPVPESDAQAETAMHMLRTQRREIARHQRLWSHDWLTERGLPSQLPDALKRKRDRQGPGKIVEGVGISFSFRLPELRPAGAAIQRAMELAVEDAYAEGRTDPVFVRARIDEARDAEARRLFGSLTPPT